MTNLKLEIESIILKIEAGDIPADKAWDKIKKLKEEYVKQRGQQSWNSFIGHRFQGMIHAILKSYARKLKGESRAFNGLEILTEGEAKNNEIILRKLAVKYGDFLLLPDVDSAIVWIDPTDKWNSEILAVISCKTSLRERIAQACYWKLKLISSDVQKNIRVFLATADNDNDFDIDNDGGRFNGRSRDRVISEYELDGIYILKEDFDSNWESDKVKRFERIFNDIIQLVKNKER
ncbi:MAG TPA: hypothetical protein DCX22_01695 [Dehalococcoidia bacterium]|nr:hypothetical protein [Dehalococcoidia bacterium]